MLLELPPQEVVIRWLTGEPIAVLCKHHRDAPGGHEIPHTVHTWPLKAGAALSGVYYLLQDLVAFTGGVLPQGFKLLGKRVAGAGLLVCGDAGVEDYPEDGPLEAVTISGRHDYSFTSSEARTPSTSAIFFSVSGWARPRCSTTATAPAERPAFSASWR